MGADCSLSLMCLEDSADIDGGFIADGAGDRELLVLCGGTEGEDDEEEYMGHLVSKESSFCSSPSSPSSPALSDLSDDWFRRARRATVKWILETGACFGFSHRTAFLAITYLDRFCLHRCFDSSAMPWAARLLAMACLSVAAKMEEYRAPPLPEYFRAGDEDYEFSSVSVRRMELLVLSTLGWRMAGVTPFDYLPCLLRGGNGGGTAAALIFATAQAASVLDYRPSTVAVAAVLAAIHGAMTKDALESKMSSLSPSCLLDKEDVYACHSLMLSESGTAKRPPPSSPDSIIGDAATASSNNKRARLLELPAIGR